MSNENKVGERIRSYREKLELTTAVLAEKSGVDENIIVAVEAGEVIPALGILTKLAHSLGQRLGTFMDDQFKADPIVTRANDDTSAVNAKVTGWGYTARSLAPGKPDRQMDPYFIELPAGGRGQETAHEGEELVICLSGRVELTYGGEKTVLGPGDTAYYNSVVTHSICAAGNAPATAYGVVFMPL